MKINNIIHNFCVFSSSMHSRHNANSKMSRVRFITFFSPTQTTLSSVHKTIKKMIISMSFVVVFITLECCLYKMCCLNRLDKCLISRYRMKSSSIAYEVVSFLCVSFKLEEWCDLKCGENAH